MEAEPIPTMLHLARFHRRQQVRGAHLEKCANPTVKAFHHKYFVEFKPLDRARAWCHPNNKVEELMRPGMREFLCQRKSLNFVSILDRQKYFFAVCPKAHGRPPRAGDRIAHLLEPEPRRFRRKKRNKPVIVVVDEIHTFLRAWTPFETMLAESRKNGIHYVFATQTILQMRNPARTRRRGLRQRVARIRFPMSAADAEQVAANFGAEDSPRELVMLPNYRSRRSRWRKASPWQATRVPAHRRRDARRRDAGAEGEAWAEANTGTPKKEIAKQIASAMGN